MQTIPAQRLRRLNDAPLRTAGRWVLYWMTACRRTRWNYALEHAVDQAHELGRPLVVLEALRCDYPYASRRLHRFVLDGMADNAARLEQAGVLAYPYVEPQAGAGRGLLEALAARACLVVADDSPSFFLPRMLDAAACKLRVRLEAVDSNGLLPLRAADRVYPTAHGFRRWMHGLLPEHLGELPAAEPLRSLRLPRLAEPLAGLERWPRSSLDSLRDGRLLERLPVDATVPPIDQRGGEQAGRALAARFVDERLGRYAAARNDLDDEATSGLSPYLHFGHVAAHEVFARVVETEAWAPQRIERSRRGARVGWWGMSESAEAFLDQLLTWRELGFNMSWQRPDAHDYASLPEWAQLTLAAHSGDRRAHVYTHDDFEAARTHDPLWNAAQVQLLREGRIHNYLRMLWGKKILEWSPSPEQALATMIALNDRWAVDGRDPNSYSGIFWILGRYDRPWGPERAVFGTVRYMSSDSTARKLRLRGYRARYDPKCTYGTNPRQGHNVTAGTPDAEQVSTLGNPHRTHR